MNLRETTWQEMDQISFLQDREKRGAVLKKGTEFSCTVTFQKVLHYLWKYFISRRILFAGFVKFKLVLIQVSMKVIYQPDQFNRSLRQSRLGTKVLPTDGKYIFTAENTKLTESVDV